MKNLTIALFVTLLLATVGGLAFAQEAPPSYSIWDVQHRLTVGARFYRSFDERPGIAGSYSSSWFAGVPCAYILTGAKNADGSVNPLPLSVIGAVDVGLAGSDQRRVRGYIGLAVLLKGVN